MANNNGTRYRVYFTEDHDSKFEESNGEPRPFTEAEYANNQYRGCPDHWRAGHDVTSTPNVSACSDCGRLSTDWADVPYAEYLAYYGNPAKHRYVGVVVEVQSGIKDWTVKASLWSIDFMIDNPEWRAIRGRLDTKLTPDEATTLPGYLADVAREQLDEAGYYDE
jgi:hypothetical protein